jgi:hypothetical protein
MNDITLPPFAPILIESTRSLGHSFESALADIIDNSISKEAKEIGIYFRSIDNPYVAIIDDACGMDKDELIAAMRYGSTNPLKNRAPNDLGRFGLGLKVASFSQCRRLTVVTKKDNVISSVRWDLDHVIQKGDWMLMCLDQEEIEVLPHIDKLMRQKSGTIVIWENLDKLFKESLQPQKLFDEKIEIARSHVALIYHRFLGSINPLKIYFNDLRVDAIDPFLENNPATQPLPEQDLLIDQSVIKVKPYVLPYVSKMSSSDKRIMVDANLKHSQGFYVYRNKRLIIWGTWFRLINQFELNKLARVRVDIPNTLDSIWEIDVKKSTATLPDIVKRNLISMVERTVGVSEHVYKYRGRNINNDDIIHMWNLVDDRGSYKYLVNKDFPIYKALESSLNEKQLNFLESLTRTIEDSFPYGDVYYRTAKSDNNVQQINLDYDVVYKIAINMIDSLRETDGNIRSFIDTMDKYDFFIKYPEVIKTIRKEFKDE